MLNLVLTYCFYQIKISSPLVVKPIISKIVVFLFSVQSYVFPHAKAVRRTTRSGVRISFKCGKNNLDTC